MAKPFVRTLNAIRSAQTPSGRDVAEAIDDLTNAISQLLSVATPAAAPVTAKSTQATGATSSKANAGPGKTLGQPTGAGAGQPRTGYISQILTSSPSGPIVGPYSSLIVATADSDLTTDPIGSVLTADGAGNVTGQALTYLFGLPSYSSGIENSPSLVIAGAFQYAAGKYEEDFWLIQDAIGSGINGSSTLEILHAGTNGPLSVLLGLDPFTAQVANSPSLVIAGSYEASSSGPAFAEDSWSIQDVIGSGVNGSSTLTITHKGSSGAAYVSFPNTLGILVNGQLLGTSAVINLATQVTGVLPTANGGAYDINTQNVGEFLGIPFDPYLLLGVANSVAVSCVLTSASDIFYCTFQVYQPITFTKASVCVSVLSAGATYYLGIYKGLPAAGASLAIGWSVASPASTGIVTDTVTSTTLSPGIYALAWTCTNTTMALYGLALNSLSKLSPIMNQNANRLGYQSSGGGSTLPTAVSSATFNVSPLNTPFVLLEP